VLQRQGRVGDCAASACSSIVPNANYHLVTEIISPRIVRGGVRLSF